MNGVHDERNFEFRGDTILRPCLSCMAPALHGVARPTYPPPTSGT